MTTGHSSGGSIAIGISGAKHSLSKFQAARGHNIHIDIPPTFSSDHIAIAAKDAELIQALLVEKPQAVADLMAATSAGRFDDAKAIAKTLGLTEAEFIRQGGGILAIVIIIAVAAALLLEHD